MEYILFFLPGPGIIFLIFFIFLIASIWFIIKESYKKYKLSVNFFETFFDLILEKLMKNEFGTYEIEIERTDKKGFVYGKIYKGKKYIQIDIYGSKEKTIKIVEFKVNSSGEYFDEKIYYPDFFTFDFLNLKNIIIK